MTEPYRATFTSAIVRERFRAIEIDAREVEDVLDADDMSPDDKVRAGELNTKVPASMIVTSSRRNVVIGARLEVLDALLAAIAAEPAMVEFTGTNGAPVRIDAFSVSRVLASPFVRDGETRPATLVYSERGSGHVLAPQAEVNERLGAARAAAQAHIPD